MNFSENEAPTIRVARPVELAPPCPKLRRYHQETATMIQNDRSVYDSEGQIVIRPLVPLGRAPSESRIRTQATVRDVLTTLARSFGVAPDELDTMTAAEFTRRRDAMRASGSRETVRP